MCVVGGCRNEPLHAPRRVLIAQSLTVTLLPKIGGSVGNRTQFSSL